MGAKQPGGGKWPKADCLLSPTPLANADADRGRRFGQLPDRKATIVRGTLLAGTAAYSITSSARGVVGPIPTRLLRLSVRRAG